MVVILVFNIMVIVSILIFLLTEDVVSALVGGVHLVWWSIVGWAIYAAVHFISKYW